MRSLAHLLQAAVAVFGLLISLSDRHWQRAQVSDPPPDAPAGPQQVNVDVRELAMLRRVAEASVTIWTTPGNFTVMAGDFDTKPRFDEWRDGTVTLAQYRQQHQQVQG